MIPAIAILLACYTIPRLIIAAYQFDATIGEKGTGKVAVSFVTILGILGVAAATLLVVAAGNNMPSIP